MGLGLQQKLQSNAETTREHSADHNDAHYYAQNFDANYPPVEKSLGWHNAINLQGAGAGNKLVNAPGFTAVFGSSRNMLVAVSPCWLPHSS